MIGHNPWDKSSYILVLANFQYTVMYAVYYTKQVLPLDGVVERFFAQVEARQLLYANCHKSSLRLHTGGRIHHPSRVRALFIKLFLSGVLSGGWSGFDYVCCRVRVEGDSGKRAPIKQTAPETMLDDAEQMLNAGTKKSENAVVVKWLRQVCWSSVSEEC